MVAMVASPPSPPSPPPIPRLPPVSSLNAQSVSQPANYFTYGSDIFTNASTRKRCTLQVVQTTTHGFAFVELLGLEWSRRAA